MIMVNSYQVILLVATWWFTPSTSSKWITSPQFFEWIKPHPMTNGRKLIPQNGAPAFWKTDPRGSLYSETLHPIVPRDAPLAAKNDGVDGAGERKVENDGFRTWKKKETSWGI